MKISLTIVSLLLLLFISTQSLAQTKVVLSVNQAPELGFDVISTDTTIVRGDSLTLGKDLTVFGGSGDYTFIWTPGSTLNDSTIMNPVATPEDTTTYNLTVLDNYGCSFSVDYKVSVRAFPVSVNERLEKTNSLFAKLFPNPNDGKFRVELTGKPQEKIKLLIIDQMGRIIQQQELKNFLGNQTEIFELKLPDGVYTLLIITDSDRLQRQFIIQ